MFSSIAMQKENFNQTSLIYLHTVKYITTVLIQTIQFSISKEFKSQTSILLIDRTLSAATPLYFIIITKMKAQGLGVFGGEGRSGLYLN